MNAIPYKITGINIDKFILSGVFPTEDNVVVNVHSNYSFSVNLNNNAVKCTSGFSYLYKEADILQLQISCIFIVEPNAFAKLYNENGDFVIEKEFLRYMATISVGAARGIIVAKTESTPLVKVVLPPINLVEAIESDFIMKGARK